MILANLSALAMSTLKVQKQQVKQFMPATEFSWAKSELWSKWPRSEQILGCNVLS
jgi:hypothetical protein